MLTSTWERESSDRAPPLRTFDLERLPLGMLIQLRPSAIIELAGLQTMCPYRPLPGQAKREAPRRRKPGLHSNAGCLAWS
jgi:hypothetical protein